MGEPNDRLLQVSLCLQKWKFIFSNLLCLHEIGIPDNFSSSAHLLHSMSLLSLLLSCLIYRKKSERKTVQEWVELQLSILGVLFAIVLFYLFWHPTLQSLASSQLWGLILNPGNCGGKKTTVSLSMYLPLPLLAPKIKATEKKEKKRNYACVATNSEPHLQWDPQIRRRV